MSHSLHREGTVENLQNDYACYARTSRWVNRDGCGPKLRKIFDIMISEKVVNFGHSEKSLKSGLSIEDYVGSLNEAYGVCGCFSDKKALKSFLLKYKAADTGISLVVSGLIDEIVGIAEEIDLKPHTAFLSLGVHGKRALLPEDKILEITTMCGHGMVSSRLTAAVVNKVRSGRMSPQEGAHQLAQPCPCGIFNTDRCQALLEQLAD
ncbi:MAG: hypothetical protein AB1427_18415 [Thermodesulfobacteriota bacterium]